MDKNTIEQIRLIFDEVINLPADKRESALDIKCKGDEHLKKEILSLIKSVEDSDDFLEAQLPESEEKNLNEKDPFIGKHIGPYLVEDEAGIGGMGIVYAGKRDDKSFEQKVAIKILKHGFTSGYFLKRFFRERQTLANLQHPNIARLLDGGSTDDGLPYLVLEFIDGDSITEYCDKNKLTIKERLELFRIVCSAVQYAHQNLVIHRDLKPGNILVDKNGKPKLLDFGIAKLLDEEIEDDREGLTRTGVWHLTPDYASPEQIKGEQITTTSDIYSLGILLYQLLTGHQPYKITTKSPIAINNTLSEIELIKPSDRIIDTEEIKASDGTIEIISPETVSILRKEKSEKLKQHLQGDLDNIILKAISKEPERRYASVEQFSEDIRRHLTGLPVIARSDTVGYRVSKFIKRHKPGVAFTAVFILFLLVSIIGIRIQANIAADERDNAKIEAEKFERVNKFLQDMLASVNPDEIGRDVKVRDVLDKAAQDVEKELKDKPEIEAAIRRTLGNTYTSLGEYDLAKIHLVKALAIDKKNYGEESENVAINYYDLAYYYHWLGDLRIADSLYNKSLSIFRKVLKEPTRDLALTLNGCALVQSEYGNFTAAVKFFEEALNILKTKFGTKDVDYASILNNLAITTHSLNDLDKAEKYYLEAQKIFIEVLGEKRTEVASTYNNLAFIYMDKKDYARAEANFTKSYKLKLELKGKDHPDVGLALNNLGTINLKLKKYKEAVDFFNRAIIQLKKTLPDEHAWLANSYFGLGKTLTEMKDYKNAEHNLRHALQIRKKIFPNENSVIYVSMGELGTCLFLQNKLIEAENLLVAGYNGNQTTEGGTIDNTKRFAEYLIKLYEKKNDEKKTNYYKNALLNFNNK